MSAPYDRGAGHPLLRERLENPAITLDLAALPEHWQRTLLVFECDRPSGLEDGPWLLAALRGAWGQQFLRGEDSRSCVDPFGRPTAREVFFRTHGWVTPKLPVPRPFIIGLDAHEPKSGGLALARLSYMVDSVRNVEAC